ncbi:hypothetical protein OIV83_000716 [Microbotryomycetes sp. JL201]|nr:hypothetical protein OIV83_000716 [Microbotryomycetes sp. JL201]
MTAIFNLESLVLVILLLICTCTYARATAPGLVDRNKEGFLGVFWKFARIVKIGTPLHQAVAFASRHFYKGADA